MLPSASAPRPDGEGESFANQAMLPSDQSGAVGARFCPYFEYECGRARSLHGGGEQRDHGQWWGEDEATGSGFQEGP